MPSCVLDVCVYVCVCVCVCKCKMNMLKDLFDGIRIWNTMGEGQLIGQVGLDA